MTDNISIKDANGVDTVIETNDRDGVHRPTSGTGSADTPSIDAAARFRVSNPETRFDSKQIFDNQPLYWDEELETGAGITSAHSADTASTVLTSTVLTAGVFTRQTFMRFNYQPGKSSLILMSGILQRSIAATGLERRIGYFDDDNGLFFADDSSDVKVVRRTNVTGTPIDNEVDQDNWNLDTMDGNGPSGITVDWTKAQLFVIDFEWLGVGRVRMGLDIDGKIYYVHEFLNANILDKVYISTPNLPLRYQMVTTSSTPASTMECICCSVMSEGGTNHNGPTRYHSTGGAHVDCATENTIYAILGLRLKSGYLGAQIDIVDLSMIEIQGSKFYEWLLIFNPTKSQVLTWTAEANSAIESGLISSETTVTAGTGIEVAGGMISSAFKGGTSLSAAIENALRLGADISGNVDELILAVKPVGGTSGLDIEASISWREGS